MRRFERWLRREMMASVLRAVVLVLALPLGFAGTMPLVARMIEGPAAHVCRCAMHAGQSTCACPICNRKALDHDEHGASAADSALAASSAQFGAAIRGTCGDDDPVHDAKAGVAILAAARRLLPAQRAFQALFFSSEIPPPDVALCPPLPPPRSFEAV